MSLQAVDFRPDINGLRAIAVIAVMLFHFGIAGFSGGFVGVDVFFVISGYLMTRIILDPLAEERFSLLRFYLARARRIFPALTVLGVLLLLYGWFNLSPIDFKQLAKHAGASLLFLSNQVFWKESGYFDADAHEKWLLHTWSLSVEWQFYLLYPLLVVAVHRLFRRPGGVAGALWAVFLASLAWSAWLAFANPSKAFFLLPTRAWEMLAGGLIFVHQDACNRLARGRRWLEPAGLAAIVAAAMLFSPDTSWPGLAALLPVAGAMLVILNSTGKTALLGSAPLQGIGCWSYSIYLWHWPIIVWLHQSQLPRHGAWVAVGMVASVLCGWLSFRLVENPARRFINRFRLAPALVVSATMVLAPFAAAAALYYQSERLTALRFKDHPLLPTIQSIEAQRVAYWNGGYQSLYREEKCLLTLSQGPAAFAAECSGEEARIVLWGDSHAAHLWPGLKAITKPGSVAQWTASGCPPLLGVDFPKSTHCRAINQAVLARLKSSRPPIVILAGSWVMHDEAVIRRGLSETLARLGDDHSWKPTVVVVGSVPTWRNTLPSHLASDFLAGDESIRSSKGLDASSFRQDALVRLIVGTQAFFFSPISTACNQDGCIRFFVKGNARIPFSLDYGHLLEESSRFIASRLLEHAGLASITPNDNLALRNGSRAE